MSHDPVMAALADLDFEVRVTGHKSSEGDGRTAADVERDLAQQVPEDAPNGAE